jgi:TnpA family transposase
MPLAALFGSGTSSSSDGQHFPLNRRAQGTGAVNPHKGSEPAVSFYTHVSDRYASFHSKVISAGAGEAAHVLDGPLHHGADLSIERHHTDGGGVSDHIFAMCHGMGFLFAPRIPNLSARRLHLFKGLDPGPDVAPLLGEAIDEQLITSHWIDVLRLMTSVRTGATSASAMLERLGSYPRANGLALALREIGRVERTLFTLDWIEHPDERRRATRELNKGEAENALKRAIFFHRASRLRDHGLQAQSHRASALNLVRARSYSGTRPTSKPRCDTLSGRAGPCPPTCSSTCRRSAGSTSTSPATISGPSRLPRQGNSAIAPGAQPTAAPSRLAYICARSM